jgi:hypothetical protein
MTATRCDAAQNWMVCSTSIQELRRALLRFDGKAVTGDPK